MLQVCPNGTRTRADSAAVPLTPAELAAAVAAAVRAGAGEVHLHPKTVDGADTLEPAAVGAAVEAVRSAVPGVPVGVTTGAWAVADPADRVGLVRRWPVRPDYASVNWHEPGAAELARALLDRGIGVEAGIYSSAGTAAAFLASGLAGSVLRVLAEVTDDDPAAAVRAGRALLDELAPNPAPILLHGEGGGAWPVLRLAGALGLDQRIGLEDVLVLPDGRPAPDNAALVRAALVP